jgi:uncharacterized circularly permuted ATP-grasp superfamily protein
MAEHSASPVRAGHVAFKFHYEVTSEESFIPAASLNNTIISKEYQDLLANDPQRAERLEAFLNGVNETERFLQDGRVPSSVAVSADLDLKGTFDPILDMLASLKRESNIEGFLEELLPKNHWQS